MSQPFPGPTMPMPGPDTITVPLKPCCLAVLANEECDCAELAAQFAAAFASPIRWHITPNGVEASR